MEDDGNIIFANIFDFKTSMDRLMEQTTIFSVLFSQIEGKDEKKSRGRQKLNGRVDTAIWDIPRQRCVYELGNWISMLIVPTIS